MRISKTACALAAATALSSGAAWGGDVQGYGAAQCRQLTNLWDQANYDSRTIMLTGLGQWTFGYLSGRNAEAPLSQHRELGALDSDETALFIITQCKDFPDVYVVQIADIIYEAAPYMNAGA